ncbi:hypothetical protein C8R43DRAFT_1234019 [Mycena crocata]|nr:hypothetical protein C8R43DRAFT_1234019 [Mycena crocata]
MGTNDFTDEQPAIFTSAESDVHSMASSAAPTNAAVMAGLVPVLQDKDDDFWSRIKDKGAAKTIALKPEDKAEIDSLFGDDPEEPNPGAPELGDACDGHWEVPHDIFPRQVAQEHDNYALVSADAMPLWQNSDNSVSVSQDAPSVAADGSHSHLTNIPFTHVASSSNSNQTFGGQYHPHTSREHQQWTGYAACPPQQNAFTADSYERTSQSYLPRPIPMPLHTTHAHAWNAHPPAYPHHDVATANEIQFPPSYATYPSPNLYGVPRALSTAVHHAYMATPFSGDHPYLAASGYVVHPQVIGGQMRGTMEQVSPWPSAHSTQITRPRPSFPPGQQDASLYAQQPLRAGYGQQQQQRAVVGWNFGYQNANAPTNNANVAGYKGHHICSPSEGTTGLGAAAAPSGNSSGSDSSASTTEAASSPSNPKKRKAPDSDATTVEVESATSVTENSTTAKGKTKQRSRKGKARVSPAASSQEEHNTITAIRIKQEEVETPVGRQHVAFVVLDAEPNHTFLNSYPCEWRGCPSKKDDAGAHVDTEGLENQVLAHLVEWHGVRGRASTTDTEKNTRIDCMWGDCKWGPNNSRKHAAPKGIATHIAREHLRSYHFACRFCKEDFANKDLLWSHFPTCIQYLTPAVVPVEEPARKRRRV